MERGVRSLLDGPLKDEPTAHHTILVVLQLSLEDKVEWVMRAIVEDIPAIPGASDWTRKSPLHLRNVMEVRSPDGKRVLTVMVITPYPSDPRLPTAIHEILMMANWPAAIGWELVWLRQYIEPFVKAGTRFGGCTVNSKYWLCYTCGLSFERCLE